MKLGKALVLGFVLAALAGAQIRGGGLRPGGGFGGGISGGGVRHPSIITPGTGAAGHPTVAPVFRGFGTIPPMPLPRPVPPPGGYRPPGNITDPTFGQRLGWTVRGILPGYYGFGYGYDNWGWGRGAYPVIVPVWGGGFSQEPTVIIQQPLQPQPQTPVVIINHAYQPETANPVVRDYSDSSLPEPTLKSYEATSRPFEPATEPKPARRAAKDDEPTLYLVALKDGMIHPVLSFWREGETLHYVSMKRTINRISLSLVDQELSKRLNNERGLEFDVQ